jgi:Trypsin-like peptidase domain
MAGATRIVGARDESGKMPRMYRANMPDGSIVDVEWGYSPPIPWDEIKGHLAPRVVSVWALDRQAGFAHRLGTGLKVAHLVGADRTGSNQQEFAVVATSEHVAGDALRVVNPRAYESQSNPFSLALPRLLEPVINKRELAVAFHSGADPRAFPVTFISSNSDADLCVLLAPIPSGIGGNEALAINSDPIQVGTTVMMAGFPKYADDGIAPISDERFTTTGGLQVRTGKVISVEDRLRYKPVCGFETNIPMPPGMSGGPVFALDLTGNRPSQTAAVGICMSDSNQTENASKITVPGSSQVVAIQNLYGIGDPSQMLLDVWNEQIRAGQTIPDPQPGTYLIDVGELKSQLRVEFRREQEGTFFNVTRNIERPHVAPEGSNPG